MLYSFCGALGMASIAVITLFSVPNIRISPSALSFFALSAILGAIIGSTGAITRALTKAPARQS